MSTNVLIAGLSLPFVLANIFAGSETTYLLIAVLLLGASLSVRSFWLLVVPVLICFTAYEHSVLLNRSISLVSPLSGSPFGDLWVPAALLRACMYWIQKRRLVVAAGPAVFMMTLTLILLVGSFLFSAAYEDLPFANKEPIKFILMLGLASVLIAEVKERQIFDIIWWGFGASVVLGIIQRIAIALLFEAKNPGIYTYTGVFFCCANIVLSQTRYYGHRSWTVTALWVFALIAHMSPSRTELALTFLALALTLKALSFRSIPVLAIIATGLLLVTPLLPTELILYFAHKSNFFSAVLNSGPIGDSASVRAAEFENLIWGNHSDLLNLLFGRGIFGFIDFSSFPNASIYSESSFTDRQYEINKFYQLHFFLTEIIFFYGLVGLAAFTLALVFSVKKLDTGVEWVAFLYFALNIMFRIELVLLVPVLVIAYRERARRSSTLSPHSLPNND